MRERPVFSGGKPAALGPLRRPLIFLLYMLGYLRTIPSGSFRAASPRWPGLGSSVDSFRLHINSRRRTGSVDRFDCRQLNPIHYPYGSGFEAWLNCRCSLCAWRGSPSPVDLLSPLLSGASSTVSTVCHDGRCGCGRRQRRSAKVQQAAACRPFDHATAAFLAGRGQAFSVKGRILGEADHTEPNDVAGIDGQAVAAVGRAAAPGVEDPGAAAQDFPTTSNRYGTQRSRRHSRAGRGGGWPSGSTWGS